MLPFPEHITYTLKLCRIAKFDLFFSILEIMLWLHIVLEVAISRNPLLQKANWLIFQCRVHPVQYVYCLQVLTVQPSEIEKLPLRYY